MAIFFKQNGVSTINVHLREDELPIGMLSPCPDSNKWWFVSDILTCLYTDELETILNKLKELNGNV